MTHTITAKTYVAPSWTWKLAFCKLTLDNGKTIRADGEDAKTLNMYNVGEDIIIGKEVLKTGRFGE